jgi:hypothetical protein
MSDENTANQDQPIEGQDNGEKNNDPGVEKEPGSPAPEGEKGEDKGGGGEKAPEKEEDKTPKPKSEDSQLGTKDNGEEPPVSKRLSAKDFIIQRQQKKIDKLQKGEGEDDQPDDEGSELLPEDRRSILQVVGEALSPVLEKTIQAEDDKEIAQFIKDNPEFAPFVDKAKRYISHPTRRHLPIETVFLEVVGRKTLMQMGAEKQRLADEEAQKGQGGGSTARGGQGGVKPVWEQSEEEFAQKQEAIRRGK